MEDAKIVKLFWERNESAIRETNIKYGKLCFHIANNILYSRENAEECVNDTRLHVWQVTPPKKPDPLSVFLGRITRNLAIDTDRKKKSGKRMDTHLVDVCGEIEEIGLIQEDHAEQYAKREQIHRSMTKDGITVTLEEVVMDKNNLWIAYTEERILHEEETGIQVWLDLEGGRDTDTPTVWI